MRDRGDTVRASATPERVRDVARLWEEHRLAPFPAGLRGAELAGRDLVSLDADTAGCVFTWLGGGALDPARGRVLRSCVEDLDRVIPAITDPVAVRYYQRLRQLAVLVSATLQVPDETPKRKAP
jgi:hypothetical protein